MACRSWGGLSYDPRCHSDNYNVNITFRSLGACVEKVEFFNFPSWISCDTEIKLANSRNDHNFLSDFDAWLSTVV